MEEWSFCIFVASDITYFELNLSFFSLYNNQEVVIGLADRGHDVEGDSSIAVVQLVTKEGNKIYATSDPRKSGHGADGY